MGAAASTIFNGHPRQRLHEGAKQPGEVGAVRGRLAGHGFVEDSPTEGMCPSRETPAGWRAHQEGAAATCLSSLAPD
jgi:hypothetical protein